MISLKKPKNIRGTDEFEQGGKVKRKRNVGVGEGERDKGRVRMKK